MKKAIVTLTIVAVIAGAGYGAYRTGYLQKYTGYAAEYVKKYAGKYLGKVIPALNTSDETENEGGRVSSTDPDAVYLDSVSLLANLGSGDGLIEKFAGKIEPQETKKYSVAGSRTVDKTYVQEGDDVKKGDKLFSYDVDSMKDKLEQAKIDLERLQNSVDVSEAKQKEIEKQLAQANTPAKKLEALEAQNTLKQQKLELKSKQSTIDSINQQIENSVVFSDIDGVVKSINQNALSGSGDDSFDYSSGSDSSYITLLKVGTYRVKASCNEQNISSIYQGERMLVYSRVDPSITWQGTISQIKTDQAASGSDDSGMSSSSGDTTSSDYPFYVELDSSEGLMLGQHVYLEEDVGQAGQKDGIWLDQYYFGTDTDGSSFVWAASDDNKLEKRKVELGDTDKEEQKVEVLGGLGPDDYICQYSDDLKEGMPVAYNGLDTGDGTVNEDYTYEETEYYSGDEDSLNFAGMGLDSGSIDLDETEDYGGEELVPIGESEGMVMEYPDEADDYSDDTMDDLS